MEIIVVVAVRLFCWWHCVFVCNWWLTTAEKNILNESKKICFLSIRSEIEKEQYRHLDGIWSRRCAHFSLIPYVWCVNYSIYTHSKHIHSIFSWCILRRGALNTHLVCRSWEIPTFENNQTWRHLYNKRHRKPYVRIVWATAHRYAFEMLQQCRACVCVRKNDCMGENVTETFVANGQKQQFQLSILANIIGIFDWEYPSEACCLAGVCKLRL